MSLWSQENFRWLEDWLEYFTGSNICTLHATALLDNLRTHIIYFQDRRLKASKGAECNTLTLFVEKYLVMNAYFELSNETMKFAFRSSVPSRA